MTGGRRDGRRSAEEVSARERFAAFLRLRLTEELGQLWAREAARAGDDSPRPGLAAQVDVLDELLRRLADGRLPERNDLVVLHTAYRTHPDYDPAWSTLA